MRLMSLLAAAATLASGQLRADDAELLPGVWRVTSAASGGKDLMAEQFKGVTVTFTDTRMTS